MALTRQSEPALMLSEKPCHWKISGESVISVYLLKNSLESTFLKIEQRLNLLRVHPLVRLLLDFVLHMHACTSGTLSKVLRIFFLLVAQRDSLSSYQGCAAFQVGTFEPRNTSTPSTFDRCRAWIKHCVESHDVCNGMNPILPYRVVDVGWKGKGVRESPF